ncbi:MAG: hypothetical protein C0425_11065 [Chlorobiaceae bacterium]|nr:hypothetical protein [Chlorobiaceae bacterium]
MTHSINTSSLVKKLRKIAAYSVILSQLLASTQHLVAMELLSQSASPRKVYPEKSMVQSDGAVRQNHTQTGLQVPQATAPFFHENDIDREISAGANIEGVEHNQKSSDSKGIIKHLFQSPSKIRPAPESEELPIADDESINSSDQPSIAEEIVYDESTVHHAPVLEELPIAENENTVHPTRGTDIRPISDDESVDSIDERHCSEADLKRFNTYLDNNLRYDFSTKDYALFAGVLIGTALLGYGCGFDNMGEIFAEARMWIDNVFLTFSQTVEGYRFTYMNQENDNFFNEMEKLQKINSYLFLTPYVATRLYAMTTYVDSCVSTYLPTVHTNRALKGLLYTGAILGGANAGGSLASQYYSNNIAFAEDSNDFARILTPYILTFYCLDAILTYGLFVQNKVIPEMVKYREPKEDHIYRKKLSSKLENTKEVLASMNDEEILTLDLNPTIDVESQNDLGVKKLQNLLDLSHKNVQHRRYSMNPAQPKELHGSIIGFLKSKWHYLLGTAIVGAGSFLTYKTNYTNATSFLNTKFSWNFQPDQFSSMGDAAYQSFSLAQYNVWQQDTQNIEIYNGNGTDWCSSCFDSAKFTIGNQAEGGELYFENCPGVSFTQGLTANPGDLEYGEICYTWFNFFDHWLASHAGIETDDYYAPLETNSHLDPTKYGFANFLAVCGTVASGIFAIKALDESFKRIHDSFSSTPQDILPGKKNKLVNAVVLPLSMIQALNRSAGNAMLAWVLMQEYNVHPVLQWSVVGSSMLTSSMTYFMNFDDAYSQLPGNLAAIYTQGKNVVFSKLNADYMCTESAFVKCENLIKQANTMQDAIAVANIDALKENLI